MLVAAVACTFSLFGTIRASIYPSYAGIISAFGACVPTIHPADADQSEGGSIRLVILDG